MSESLRKALRLFDLLHGQDFKSAPELAAELAPAPTKFTTLAGGLSCKANSFA